MVWRTGVTIVVLVLETILTACRVRSYSQVRVTDSQPTNQFQEVVKITPVGTGFFGDEVCSGTFISPRMVLTAAHCQYDPDELNNGNIRRADKMSYQAPDGKIHYGRMVESDTYEALKATHENIYHDLAVVVFDEDIAPKTATFALKTESLAIGDELTIVGFGINDLVHETGEGVKRIGKNKILDFEQNAFVIRGSIYPTDLNYPGTGISTFGAGDSGGAVFNQKGELVGIINAGDPADAAMNTSKGKRVHGIGLDLRHDDTRKLIGNIKRKLCQSSP